MADYSRTRVTLATLTASIKTLLTGSPAYSWTLKEYQNTNLADLFMYLKSLTRVPACILIYNSGKSGNESPHRELSFSVIVVTRYMTNGEAATQTLQGLIDQAITALDYQIVNSYVQLKFQSDETLQLDRGSMLTASKLTFIAEDYTP